MWKISENLYSRIRAYYFQRGMQGINSGVYEKLPLSTQQEIISLIGFNSGEEDILLASFLKDEYLVVITNEKVYWLSTDSTIKSETLENINRVDFGFANSSLKNRPFVDCIKIITKDERQFMIKMEAGGPCSSMLNVLGLVIRLNK